jgi:hypothetical protein
MIANCKWSIANGKSAMSIARFAICDLHFAMDDSLQLIFWTQCPHNSISYLFHYVERVR